MMDMKEREAESSGVYSQPGHGTLVRFFQRSRGLM